MLSGGKGVEPQNSHRMLVGAKIDVTIFKKTLIKIQFTYYIICPLEILS